MADTLLPLTPAAPRLPFGLFLALRYLGPDARSFRSSR